MIHFNFYILFWFWRIGCKFSTKRLPRVRLLQFWPEIWWFSRQKISSSQGRLGHGGSEGRLHRALVDKASLRWRLHYHNCRVPWQVEAWSQPLNNYVGPLFEQVGGSARRQKLFEISWKCRVCGLLLWACTTGTKYFRNSQKLMMGEESMSEFLLHFILNK